jgi:hypothetical protein
MPISKATRNAIIWAGVGVLLLQVFIVALSALTDVRRNPGVQGTLSALASEVTKKCPLPVDQDTVLVGAVAGPGLRLRYDYSLPRRSQRDLQKVDLDAFAGSVKQNQLAKLRSVKSFRPLMDAGVVWEFSYVSSDGHRVLTVQLTPADYR